MTHLSPAAQKAVQAAARAVLGRCGPAWRIDPRVPTRVTQAALDAGATYDDIATAMKEIRVAEGPAAIRAAAAATVRYGVIGAPIHPRWEEAMTTAYALGATADEIASEARRIRLEAAR
ncbi:hypothetical protein AB0F42_19255 [Streptomyces buecherae]|uniref:hypothetical protein n=1 Tax=Streptomyces buecherae TaxID=2763006 RepID=UPI0034077E39